MTQSLNVLAPDNGAKPLSRIRRVRAIFRLWFPPLQKDAARHFSNKNVPYWFEKWR